MRGLLLGCLGLGSVAAVAFAAIGVSAFTSSESSAAGGPLAVRQERAHADYTFAMTPSTLYPDGVARMLAADAANGHGDRAGVYPAREPVDG